MIAAGILGPDDRTELLDGILVVKMSKNSERTISDDLVRDSLSRRLPTGWFYRTQDPIALDVSEPEPDFFVARGKPTDYRGRQPSADEVALVVEVAESSLSRDRNWKSVIYARNRIPVYWIVNLLDSTLEVYTDLTGSCEEPKYRQSKVLTLSDRVEVLIADTVVATIPVSDLIPETA